MKTPLFIRISTIILLLFLTVSCTSSAVPTALLTVQTRSTPVTVAYTPLPAETSIAVQKTPRVKKTPATRKRDQGTDVSQNLLFEIPEHPVDVILGRPTTNSIAVSLLAYTKNTVMILYGTTSGNYTNKSNPINLEANIPQIIDLLGLLPDTLYYYSINGIENSFHTARPTGSTFAFAIQADSHLDSNTNPEVYLQTLANERADHPDFVIDLGDTFMTEKYKPYTSAESQYVAQRYFMSRVAETTALFLVLGNHDGEGAPRGNVGYEMSTWAALMRTRYFPNPIPDSFYTGNTNPDPTAGYLQDYYAWEWGDALLIVLDPYWYTPPQSASTSNQWNPTLGYDQYQWLKTTLETSQARWKFIFIHQLIGGKDQNGRGGIEVAGLYEWGGNNEDGSYGFDTQRPGWGMPIHQLLVSNHVTAVFHGHDHLFAKEELDGIVYQEVPQPGANRTNDINSALEYGYMGGDTLGSPGYLRVNVSPNKVTVDYICTYLPKDEKDGQQNGQVDYSYSILH